MPHVIPSDEEKFALYKTTESKVSIPVAYRRRICHTLTVGASTTFSWRLSVKTAPEKPRYIIIGFQTGKANN